MSRRLSAVAVLLARRVALPALALGAFSGTPEVSSAQERVPVTKPPLRDPRDTGVTRIPRDTGGGVRSPRLPGQATDSGVVRRPPVSTTPASTSAILAADPGAVRYRVTLNGFTANRQSNDTPFQTDGKGDEIYFATWVAVLDTAAERMAEHWIVRSREMGDVNGFAKRVKMGGASDRGGIRTGDRHPSPAPFHRVGRSAADSLPMVLWEGALVPGRSAVVLTPTVWEWDDDPELFGYWAVSRGVALDWITRPELLLAAIVNPRFFPIDVGSPGFHVESNMWADARDRPIGLVPGRPQSRASSVAPKTGAGAGARPLGTPITTGSITPAALLPAALPIVRAIFQYVDAMSDAAEQMWGNVLSQLLARQSPVFAANAGTVRKLPLPWDADAARASRQAMLANVERIAQDPASASQPFTNLAESAAHVARDLTATKLFFREQTLVLSPEALENAIRNAPRAGGRPPGIIDVSYHDHGRLQGVYTLHLQVERLP